MGICIFGLPPGLLGVKTTNLMTARLSLRATSAQIARTDFWGVHSFYRTTTDMAADSKQAAAGLPVRDKRWTCSEH